MRGGRRGTAAQLRRGAAASPAAAILSAVLLLATLLSAHPPAALPARADVPPQDVPRPSPPKAAPAADPARPSSLAAPPPPRDDDRGLDVLSYDLQIALDPSTRFLAGSVAVGLRAVRPGVQRIVLDLTGNLACTAVEFAAAGARQAVPYAHAGDSLVIALPQPLATVAPETLRIAWQGEPLPHGPFGAGFMWRSHDAGTPDFAGDDAPAVATVAEPWSAHSWWPCKDHPADRARVGLEVTVPDTLVVVANGRLIAADAPAAGLRRTRWREDHPIATYLVSLAVSNYRSWTQECRPAAGPAVPLEFHVFPQDESRARSDLAPTCAMLDFLTSLAGPYPFADEKYAQAEIKWGGAMENQTATSLGQFLLTGDGRWETVLVHELAHQWFGDGLTPRRWADIWLNEGFARYAEALWVQRQSGPAAYRDFLLAVGPRRHPDLFLGEGLLGDPDPILPNAMVYDKGAWLLHTLRQLLGDADFFAFLSEYAQDPVLRGQGTDTAGMIAVAERTAGRPLDRFFDLWLTTEAVPAIALQWEGAGSAPSPRALVTLRQLQEPQGEVPVPLRLYTAAGAVDRLVVLDAARRTFALQAPARVDSVAVDPDSLAFLTGGQPAPAALKVDGPHPNPAAGTGPAFMLTLQTACQVNVNVYDARGYKVDARDLGLLPASPAAEDEPAAPHLWRWDPQGADAPLAAGVYWLEFRGAGARVVRKAVWLR